MVAHQLRFSFVGEQDFFEKFECFEESVSAPHDLVVRASVDGVDVLGGDVLDVFVAVPNGVGRKVLKMV